MESLLHRFEWLGDLDLVLSQLITGAGSGISIFILGVGLSIIYGVTKVVNLAHGSLYMLGAYIMWSCSQLDLELASPVLFILCIIFAGLGSGVIGATFEATLLRRIYDRSVYLQAIITIGLFFIINSAVQWIWGGGYLAVETPSFLDGSIEVAGTSFPTYYVMMLTLAPLMTLGLWLLFHRTRWGKLTRAATDDRYMLGALGINTRRIFTSTFFFGSWLAGLGGAISAPLTGLSPGIGISALLSSLVVVAIGGIGSIIGCFVASILMGILNSFGIMIFPEFSAGIIYMVMALILIIRPEGIFGERKDRKAKA